MKRLLLNLLAFVIVVINYIFNSYLLAWLSAFIYSVGYIIMYHTHPSVSFRFFILFGFISILILILIGVVDIPLLAQVMTNSRVLLKSEREKINPLVKEVLTTINNPVLSPPRILISDDIMPNASSYGKNTLILEKILLINYNDDEIKAVLFHEMSHLINKDSLIILVVFWISVPMQLIMWLYQKYASICLRATQNLNKSLFNMLLLIPLIIFSPIIVLNFIGKILLNLTFVSIRRMFEYESDKFVVNSGYRDALISFLEKQIFLQQSRSIIDKIMADNPGIVKRIARLEKY